MNPNPSTVPVSKVQTTLSEQQIIDKILSGQKELFEVIIRKYNPILHKIGMSYGFSHMDTQDLMQETFVNAFCKLSSFEHRSSLKTWIIRIMLNACFHKRQKASFLSELPSHISDNSIPMFSHLHEQDVDKKVINSELCRIIEQALNAIPLDYRMTFSLREINGLSVAETAEALELSESNVKVRLNRAKKMLRKELEKTYSPQDLFEFNLIYCNMMVDRIMIEIAPHTDAHT